MKIKNTIKFTFVVTVLAIAMGAFNAQASTVTKEEIIDLTNAEREANGLQPLVENETLNKAAFLKVQDMIGHNYFSHTSPQGVDPWHWFDETGYTYRYAGENLAMDFHNANSVHRAWMKSKTHKDNIISKKFEEIGVAVLSGIMDGKETQVAVQLFGTRLSSLEKENMQELEKIKGETENSIEIKIKKASMNPWEGSFEDEMLVFTEVEGQPQKVELIVKEKNYNLEKLRDGIYMNLISLEDINLAQDQLAIKATVNNENAIFYQVPKDRFNDYLVKKEKGSKEGGDEDDEEMIFMGSTEPRNRISEIFHPFNPDNLLIVIMGVFLVTIANVWILEKEEEKLLKSAKV